MNIHEGKVNLTNEHLREKATCLLFVCLVILHIFLSVFF